jgi:hypothetical protein
LDAKGKHNARVWLQEGWQRRLDERRERGGELRRGRQQAVRHRQDRDGFRAFSADVVTDEEPPLKGAERVREIVETAEKRDQAARVEEQRRKVGTTAETFLTDQLAGVSGFAWGEVLKAWKGRGGTTDDLRRAARSEPFMLQREVKELCVYWRHAAPEPERKPAPVAILREPGNLIKPHISPAAPTPQNLEKPETGSSPAEDWRSHSLACECHECLSPMPTRYATPVHRSQRPARSSEIL